MKYKINWIGIFIVIGYSMLFGFLAIGLPQKICLINSWESNCFYGLWASYVSMLILGYVFLSNFKMSIPKKKGELSLIEKIKIFLIKRRRRYKKHGKG